MLQIVFYIMQKGFSVSEMDFIVFLQLTVLKTYDSSSFFEVLFVFYVVS